MLDYDPDVVIAIGGGSAIDSAKSIREFATEHLKSCTYAVPTTSGTAVKLQVLPVVSDPANDIKYPLVSDSMLPTEAILDADLVKKCSGKHNSRHRYGCASQSKHVSISNSNFQPHLQKSQSRYAVLSTSFIS